MPWKHCLSLTLYPLVLLLAIAPAIAMAGDDLSDALRRADHDTAIRIFTQYLNAEGRTPFSRAILYNQRGIEYACKGEFDLAMQDYNQAIKLRPKFALAFANRGLTYEEMDQPDLAIQDFEQVIRLKPEDIMGYMPLAWLYASGRDKKFLDGKKALQYAQKAVNLRRETRTLNTLAAAQARNGQFREAAETQAEALHLLKSMKDVPPDMLQETEARMALYRSGKPYTLPPLLFNRAIYKRMIRDDILKNQ